MGTPARRTGGPVARWPGARDEEDQAAAHALGHAHGTAHGRRPRRGPRRALGCTLGPARDEIGLTRRRPPPVDRTAHQAPPTGARFTMCSSACPVVRVAITNVRERDP